MNIQRGVLGEGKVSGKTSRDAMYDTTTAE